jgi:hypothetical protein
MGENSIVNKQPYEGTTRNLKTSPLNVTAKMKVERKVAEVEPETGNVKDVK